MPKLSKKRVATKNASKVARKWATGTPVLKKPAVPVARESAFARFLRRYPVALGMLLSALVLVTALLAFNNRQKLGLVPKPTPTSIPTTTATVAASPTAAPTTAAALPTPVPSACNKVEGKLLESAKAPAPANILRTYKSPPPLTIDQNKLYCAVITTKKGNIFLELRPKEAPLTVNNFVFLAEHNFYDGLKFHRVEPEFVIQGGDPNGDGSGGPSYKFADEPVKGEYVAGALAMANSGPNTNGSQFFIDTVDDTAKLAKSYNLFGQVITGMDVVRKITVGDVMQRVVVIPAS